jgi:hypothetical protein
VRLISLRRHGVRRTIAVLDPTARRTYVRLAAIAAPAVEAALGPRVMANRVLTCRAEPPALTLRPWRHERRSFAHALGAFASTLGAVAIADVQDCFGSIGPALARTGLERIEAPQGAAVERFLWSLAREGVAGLPVGPDPSAVFANAVLACVDRALEDEGVPYLRWVDDFVIGGDDRRAAAHAVALLGEALRGLGLRLNVRKTRIVDDPSDLAEVVPSGTYRSPGRVG